MSPGAGLATRLVFATDLGRTCPSCRRALAACLCRAQSINPMAVGPVRVGRQNKGRGGKTVTLVSGLPPDADALAALGKRLRSACGAGGTLKDGVLEVQGDHVQRVMALLQSEGWSVKRTGG